MNAEGQSGLAPMAALATCMGVTIGASFLIAMMLSRCDRSDVDATDTERAWTIAAAASCPQVSSLVDRSMADGRLDSEEVDAVAAAVRVVVANPVKGQTCGAEFRHRPRPSTRFSTEMIARAGTF